MMNFKVVSIVFLIVVRSFSVHAMEGPAEIEPPTLEQLLEDGFLYEDTDSVAILKEAQAMHNQSDSVALLYKSARLRNIDAFYALGVRFSELGSCERAADWFHFANVIHWYRTGIEHQPSRKYLKELYLDASKRPGFRRDTSEEGSWPQRIQLTNNELPTFATTLFDQFDPQTIRRNWILDNAKRVFFSSLRSRFEQMVLLVNSDENAQNVVVLTSSIIMEFFPKQYESDIRMLVMHTLKNLGSPADLSLQVNQMLLTRLLHNAVRAGAKSKQPLDEELQEHLWL